MVTRHGFNEETYFTFTFSPLRDDDGAIAGIYQPVLEVTETVLAERRAETLRSLAPRPGSHDPIEDAFLGLAANRKDVPFALCYLRDDNTGQLRCVTSCRADGFDRARVDKAGAELASVPVSPTKLEVRALLGDCPLSEWSNPTEVAVAVPLRRNPSQPARGVIVFGLSPNLHFDDKYVAFFESVAREIATNREAEDARAQIDGQRARLQAIFMQAPVAITLLRGAELVVELANPLMCRVLGRSQDQLVGKRLFDALPETAGQGLEELLSRVLTTGEPYVGTEVPVNIARLEGGGLDEAFFSFVYEPMRDASGAVEGVMVVAADVTTQVRARQATERLALEVKASQQLTETAREEAESANRAKDEFLAMLGHELRNPLAPILTALELIRLRDDGATIARERAVIERQARHMARLVDDLLDVSRITRGKIELKREVVEISEIVAKAIETASPLLEKLRHSLVTHVPVRGLAVSCDPARLVQVFANLLTNAAKYSEAGGTITINATRSQNDVVASVTDTGRGISPEMLPRIFDLFVQERQNIDRSEGGLGLGLPIVKSIVELHGGTIEAASDGHMRGSTFTIRMPFVSAAATAAASGPTTERHARVRVAVEDGARPRVLVVDDNDDAAELLASALDAYGYTTQVAHDGLQAIDMAKRTRFDAVLLDIGLPVMDGYEVARQLRALPLAAETPLIALTGYGLPTDRQRSLEAGFDEHLVKPVDISAVEALLRHVLADAKTPPPIF